MSIFLPVCLIRTKWPPTPQLVPGGSPRFDAIYESLRDGEPVHEPIHIGLDWTVIDGHHRINAARLVGLALVPVRIWTGTEWLPSEPEVQR